MEVSPPAPARDPFERSEAQRRFQRSPRFILAVAAVLAVFCGVMSIPSVVRVLGIATHDAYALAVACLAAMVFASVAMHTFGGRDRRYIIASTIENLVYAVALMTVIYRKLDVSSKAEAAALAVRAGLSLTTYGSEPARTRA